MNVFKWGFSQPILLLVIATVCWGGNTIAGKIAVGHVSPFLLTFIRWIIAVAILFPFAWPHLKEDWKIVKQHLVFLFILGAVGFTTFNNLLYLSLNHTTAINAAIIQAGMPLSVFIMNFVLFSIKTSLRQIIGFLITILGIATITSAGSIENLINLTFNYGDILILIAILAYGAYSVFLKNKPDIHWLSMILVLSLSAMVTAIPYALYEYNTIDFILPDITGYLVILYAAIFPSLVSQVFWIRGVELIGSNAAGIFINLIPIVATTLAIILLGEKLQLFHIIAFALVISGVWIAQQTKRRSDKN